MCRRSATRVRASAPVARPCSQIGSPEVPPRVEYQLTDKGRALLPLIEDMRQYGREWLGVDDDSCRASDGATPASAVAVA